jgi:hypothetical protein
MSHPTPSRPWQRVGMDIFTQASQDYLITVDYLSGYFEVDRLQTKRCIDTVYVLRQQFARHDIPSQVISDNGPFGSSEFATKWESEHITSSPNYPQSNGRAEAAVKVAKRIIQKATEAHTDPLLALLEWRKTPSVNSGLSPRQSLFGRRTRTCLLTTDSLLNTALANTAQQALNSSKKTRQILQQER